MDQRPVGAPPPAGAGPNGPGPAPRAAWPITTAAPTWARVQPEDPRPTRRIALVLGGAALATVTIVGGGFLVAGASSDEDRTPGVANAVQPASAAKEATDSFLAAARDGDCDRAYTFVKQPEQFPGQMEEDLFKKQVCADAPSAVADTTVVEQGSRTATVRAKVDDKRYLYAMEKVGGQWKVDPLASSGVEQ